MGRLILARPQIGDAEGVLELLWLLVTTVLAWVRPRQDLVLEPDGVLGCAFGTSSCGSWLAEDGE
ncbi:MAG: hypothetical protein AUG75_09150 [Cyanobacteria bacterium 13_1_20CM_4_61_6]|nr:MAG: hypothetical protein AUG75_09150 [Cyanobacteria bacterium 13_1_20CM_4_61_6]